MCIRDRGYPEVSPHDFYRELFPAGSLQQEPEDGKGNIIILDRVFGVLHHVVQQRSADRLHAQSDLLDDDFGHCDRMQQVRLARATPYPLVCFLDRKSTRLNSSH